MLNLAIETVIRLYEGYLWTLTFADTRVSNWLLMSSPKYTAYLTILYLLLVLILPMLTSNMRPLNLRPALATFSFAMAILNGYIAIELFYSSYMAGYSYQCQPVSHTYDKYEYRIACVLWWFYFSKLLEFVDTLFFILRKKYNQLTFLHVYHHSTMFCFWWIGIKWVAGGSSFLGALLNSCVHVIMYSYYGLTAAFPGSNFWWKKYLTMLQLFQFMFALVQTAIGLYIECPFPKWMGYTMICYMVSFIVLFSNFWKHAYKTSKKLKSGTKKEDSEIKNGFMKETHEFKENSSPYRRSARISGKRAEN